MDTDYQTVFDLIRTLQERHAATVEALDRAATERQTLREALANESRLCDLRGEDLARLRDRYAEAQVSRTAVEELQKNYDARGEELEAFRKRFANLEEFQRQVETLRAENLRVHLGREADDQTRATDEEWTRDDTIRKLRAQLARAQGEVAQLLARTEAAYQVKRREEEVEFLRDLASWRLEQIDKLGHDLQAAKEEARRASGARIAIIGALGICGESWTPITGDGPEAVRCTQVCSLAVGHKGAHGWGRNVQATRDSFESAKLTTGEFNEP